MYYNILVVAAACHVITVSTGCTGPFNFYWMILKRGIFEFAPCCWCLACPHLSCLVLSLASCLVVCCPVLSYRGVSCLVLLSLVLSWRCLSFLVSVLSCLVLSQLIFTCLVFSALCCFVLSCLVVS